MIKNFEDVFPEFHQMDLLYYFFYCPQFSDLNNNIEAQD